MEEKWSLSIGMGDAMFNTEGLKAPWVPRVLPFAAYMVFILIESVIGHMLPQVAASIFFVPIFYTVKTALVILTLYFIWKSCDELRAPVFLPGNAIMAVAAGVAVFVLWINMDWQFATIGDQKVYDPHGLGNGIGLYAFFAIRLVGAALVVPIFEELFWRSFILRYIIDPNFLAVRLGTYSLSSLAISSVLFGLEHYLWLAGIMAGVIYNVVLYRTGNLWWPIIAHSVTNFLLGIYVISSGEWRFW